MKKGFTLIELLVTIVILGILALIVYPNVLEIISNSKKEAYEAQIKIVEKAAKSWGYENSTSLPDIGSSSSSCVGLSLLKEKGYLAEDKIFDPRHNGKELEGVVKINYDSGKKQYVYQYRDDLKETGTISECTVYKSN